MSSFVDGEAAVEFDRLDPRIYLRDVMLRIAHEADVAKLTPHGWREHIQPEVKARAHQWAVVVEMGVTLQ